MYLDGSQLNFQMPGPEKTASTSVIAHLMESNALSEEDLFAPRLEEIPRIQNGSVTLIPVEDKQRVLDLMQEVIRLRIEVGNLVTTIMGESFVRCKRSVGEDFLYISSQPTEHMSNTPIAFLLQKLSRFLEMRFSIDIRAADLSFELPSGEVVPNGYTILDLIFVAATSRRRRDNFAENYKILRITLEYVPRVVPLGIIGQDLL